MIRNKLYNKFIRSLILIFILFILLSSIMNIISFLLDETIMMSLLITIILLLIPLISIVLVKIYYPRDIKISQREIIVFFFKKKFYIDIRKSSIKKNNGNYFLHFKDERDKERKININVFDKDIKTKIVNLYM